MTSHELARNLLDGPDVPVMIGTGDTEQLWTPTVKTVDVTLSGDGEYDGERVPAVVFNVPADDSM